MLCRPASPVCAVAAGEHLVEHLLEFAEANPRAVFDLNLEPARDAEALNGRRRKAKTIASRTCWTWPMKLPRISSWL